MNAPRSNFDPKLKPGPHTGGIVGYVSTTPAKSVMNQMENLSFNRYELRQATNSSHPTQLANVHLVQLSNQKGNQQPRLNKKKGRSNHKGGNRNVNANDDKNDNNAGGTRCLKIRSSSLAIFVV